MKKFALDYLKAEQLKVISSFIKGEDVFGIQPTGFGKSVVPPFSRVPMPSPTSSSLSAGTNYRCILVLTQGQAQEHIAASDAI